MFRLIAPDQADYLTESEEKLSVYLRKYDSQLRPNPKKQKADPILESASANLDLEWDLQGNYPGESGVPCWSSSGMLVYRLRLE